MFFLTNFKFQNVLSENIYETFYKVIRNKVEKILKQSY